MNRVLVIEDELDIAKLVQLHLQDLPCEVSLAFESLADRWVASELGMSRNTLGDKVRKYGLEGD